MTLHQFHAQIDVRALVIVIQSFADVVQKRRALGDLHIGADLGGDGRRDFGHLDRMFQNVLPVRGAVEQTAQNFHHRFGQTDVGIGTGALGGLAHFERYFAFAALQNFLDARRMNATIGNQDSPAPAARFRGEPDRNTRSSTASGVSSIIKSVPDSCSKGADVAAFAPDDAAFEVFRGERHNRDRAFAGLIDGAALNRHHDDFARALFGLHRALLPQCAPPRPPSRRAFRRRRVRVTVRAPRFRDRRAKRSSSAPRVATNSSASPNLASSWVARAARVLSRAFDLFGAFIQTRLAVAQTGFGIFEFGAPVGGFGLQPLAQTRDFRAGFLRALPGAVRLDGAPDRFLNRRAYARFRARAARP